MKHTPWIAASTLITMLSLNMGCTSSSTTQTAASMPTTPAVSVAPTTPAVSNNAAIEKKLIGQWKLNTDAIKANLTEQLESQSNNAETAEMAAMIMQMVDQMSMIIEFSADTVSIKTSMMGEEQTEENEWVLDSVDGNQLTLIINEQPSIVVLISDDVIEMVATEEEAAGAPPGMNRLRLDRVK